MAFLKNIRVIHWLSILITISALGLFIVLSLLLNFTRQQMNEDRVLLLQSQLDAATSLVSRYQQQAAAGLLDEKTAQTEALAALDGIRYLDSEYIFTFHETSLVMLQHPKTSLVGKTTRNIVDPDGKVVMVEIQKAVEAGRGKGMVDYLWPKAGEDLPQPKVSLAVQFEPWGWTIGTGMYVNDLDAAYAGLRFKAFWQSALVVIAIAIVSVYVALKITLPIKKVSTLSETVANDHDLTHTFEMQNGFEVNLISSSLSSLVASIRGVIQEVLDKSQQTNSTSEELSAATSTMREQIHTQLVAIDSIATAINEMSATVDDVARSTELTNQLADDVKTQTFDGQKVVKETGETIEKLVSEVSQAAKVIQSLKEESKDIDDIVEVITGIADQTNLLALNAAIEAARAGEQGRGFAVVADEVRSLASKTQQSTEEIRAKIESLQTQSQTAFTVMTTSRDYAETSTQKMLDVSKTFSAMTEALGHLSDQTSQIATATSQQSSVAQDVNRNISEISEQVAGTKEQAQAIEESAENLAAFAADLADTSSTFTV